MTIQLPVPVLDFPYWRVNLRGGNYERNKLPTFQACLDLINQNKIHLRGWDYPHLSPFSKETGFGENFLFSSSQYLGYEYWRLYQSGQFLHLFSIREGVRDDFSVQLMARLKNWLAFDNSIDWGSVKGVISILGFLFSLSEIFEFLSRLCQAKVIEDNAEISISINKVNGFALAPDENRVWHNLYISKIDHISFNKTVSIDQAIGNSRELAIEALAYFFERFGWLNIPKEIFKKDQEKFFNRQW